MSPDATATTAALARLLAEIDVDRAGLSKRMADLREAERRLTLDPEDPGSLALAAVGLHGWYTGLEAIFERIARELDMSLPTGERWHRDLLTQMTAEIPGIRPPVIDSSLVPELVLLLAFRHFFRHAYAVSLDQERLSREIARALGAEDRVTAALDAFAAFVKATISKIASG